MLPDVKSIPKIGNEMKPTLHGAAASQSSQNRWDEGLELCHHTTNSFQTIHGHRKNFCSLCEEWHIPKTAGATGEKWELKWQEWSHTDLNLWGFLLFLLLAGLWSQGGIRGEIWIWTHQGERIYFNIQNWREGHSAPCPWDEGCGMFLPSPRGFIPWEGFVRAPLLKSGSRGHGNLYPYKNLYPACFPSLWTAPAHCLHQSPAEGTSDPI